MYFQKDFICILMFKIIIHVFQMDINALMKYYFNVYDHNSCISNGHYCILIKYYFNVKIIFMHFKWTLIAF